MSELKVDVVSADRTVWSGEASMVMARTTDGDLGVLPGHTPLLGVLAEGQVRIRATSGGSDLTAEVGGGFISVEHDRVVIVAEDVTLDEGSSTRAGS